MFLRPTLCRRVLEHEKPHQHPHDNTPRHQVDQPHGPEVLRKGRVEPPDGNARTKEAPEVHRNGRRQRPRHRLSVVKGEPPMDVVWAKIPVSPQQKPQSRRTSSSGRTTRSVAQRRKNSALLKQPAMLNRTIEPLGTRSSSHWGVLIVIRYHVTGFTSQHLPEDGVVRLQGVHKVVFYAEALRQHSERQTVLRQAFSTETSF